MLKSFEAGNGTFNSEFTFLFLKYIYIQSFLARVSLTLMSSFQVSPPPDKLSKLSLYQEFLNDESNFIESSTPSIFLISFKSVAIQLAQESLLKFGTLAALHPFESMRILRQVQYGTAVDVKESGGFFEPIDEAEICPSERSKFTDSSTSNDADDEGDPFVQRRSSRNLFEQETREIDEHFKSSRLNNTSQTLLTVPKTDNLVEVDDFGYAQSSKLSSSNSNSNNTAWPIILNKNASIWSSCRLAAKYQGIPSLWQGIMAFWIYQSSVDISHSAIEEVLTSPIIWNRPAGLLGLFSSTISASSVDSSARSLRNFPLAPLLGSVFVTSLVNFLLTPLDLVRTRLVAQSIYASEIKCKSPLAALKTIYLEEGKNGLYPNIIFTGLSAILLPALRILPISLFTHFAENSIESIGIPAGFASALAHFIFNCTNLFITLPIETIRRRLYLQVHSLPNSAKSSARWIYRVPISQVPYSGFWNCFRRICQEEGVSALYQGWSMQLISSTILLASNIVLEIENDFPDDMESF